VYPLFHYLKKRSNYTFCQGVPAVLNSMLRNRELDLAPCSSIEYARNYKNYKLISGISISSIKEVKSVALFSNYKLKELDSKPVYVTSESGTSVILLKILSEFFLKISPLYVDKELDSMDSHMLIGDKALYMYYNNSFKYVYDLGKLWYKYTCLPFVYALWILNDIEENNSKYINFIKELEKIKNNSKKNLAALLEGYSLKGLSSYQIIDYWETIDYNLSDKHIEGLLLFYKYAYKLNTISEIPPLKLYI